MNAPCYKCQKRTPECHGSCDDYKQWKSDRDEVKEKITAERKAACADMDYIMGVKKRIKQAQKAGMRKMKGW